jgi:CheY-like chemotaxis protein
MEVESEQGVGSRFTVFLPSEAPQVLEEVAGKGRRRASDGDGHPLAIADDRESVRPGDPVLLIVEDDPNFAKILLDLARANGFRAVVSRDGKDAIDFAHRLRPAAVTLDIGLRDISGWRVLEALRQDPRTELTPVHVVSVFEEAGERVFGEQVASFHAKPVSRQTLEHLFKTLARPGSARPRVLHVVSEERRDGGIQEAAAHAGLEVVEATSAEAARQALRSEPIDCLLLDLELPEGLDLLRRVQESPRLRALSVVAAGAGELAEQARTTLARHEGAVAVVTTVSAEELLGEVERVVVREVHPQAPVPDATPALDATADGAADGDESLRGHLALVVDDDIRNVFAMTALLERYGMRVVSAESGDEALERLHHESGIEVVILDVMMPGKDGYTTLGEIRAIPDLRALPVVAVTAKAMKGDRERCLEAGATDYVAKPVVPGRLLATLREVLDLT